MKPKVKLIGADGNAFVILGRCMQIARKSKWSQEQVDQFKKEATSGDYDYLLQTVMKYFEVT